MGRGQKQHQESLDCKVIFSGLRQTTNSILRVFLLQSIGTACLFLAAKVEEQPRKLEHLIRCAHQCQHPGTPQLNQKSEVNLSASIFKTKIAKLQVKLKTTASTVAVCFRHTWRWLKNWW